MQGFVSSTIPAGVTVIGERAFEGVSIAQVTLPDGRTADLSGMRGAQRKFYADAKRRYALPADLEKGEKRVYASKADWDAAFIARLRRQAARR